MFLDDVPEATVRVASLAFWAVAVTTAVIGDVAVHSSIWPPSMAVRQRAMASRTLTCVQRIHWRLRSMKALPAARTIRRGTGLLIPSKETMRRVGPFQAP